MLTFNMKALIFIIWKLLPMSFLLIRNMKTLALTVQKLLARLKFSINRSITKVNFTGYKNWLVPTESTHEKDLLLVILMWNTKALALTVQKLLARLKFTINSQRLKDACTHGKGLSLAILIWNAKLKHSFFKVIRKFKVFKRYVKG